MSNLKNPFCDCKSVKKRSKTGILASRNVLEVTSSVNNETCDLCGHYVHWKVKANTDELDDSVIEFKRNGYVDIFDSVKYWA